MLDERMIYVEKLLKKNISLKFRVNVPLRKNGALLGSWGSISSSGKHLGPRVLLVSKQVTGSSHRIHNSGGGIVSNALFFPKRALI